ncbi:MAG: helix-turn-helix transcriptional regulator, partial [Paludibacter sp.]|nr:helix-turn-helix transcriptional regulator [Paludibacter sp.]
SRLKQCRLAKGLTQKQMAGILKINERSYQNYEGGDRTPNLEGIIALANFFNVSLDYLVGRSDNPGQH